MKNNIFYLGFGLLCTHELDAIVNNEWQILPLTNWLPIEYGQSVFILFHIPLFSFLVAMISSQNQLVRNRTKFGISVFLVAHGLLHTAYMSHQNYEFESVLSNFLIFGGAITGITYLIINKFHVSKNT